MYANISLKKATKQVPLKTPSSDVVVLYDCKWIDRSFVCVYIHTYSILCSSTVMQTGYAPAFM